MFVSASVLGESFFSSLDLASACPPRLPSQINSSYKAKPETAVLMHLLVSVASPSLSR